MLSIFLFTAFNCKDSSVTPKEIQPGGRDYVWTVDTLDIYSPATKLWGSSPNDVWCINKSDNFHSLYHFDGNKWSTDGIYRSILPHAIWGFSHNDIYIGGQKSIWRFDGSSWKQFAELEKEGTDYVSFENIWGDSPLNFYAVGAGPDDKRYFNHSVIAHYSIGGWKVLNTDALKGNVIHLYKNKPDNRIYFRLSKIGGIEHVDSTIIYEYTLGKYNKLFSSPYTKGWQADISLIDNKVYFILGNEITIRENNKFQTVLKVDNPEFYQRIWGRSSKDIFLLMTNGLAHYNGNDVEYLFYFNKADEKPWTQIVDDALFEKEVFFTTYEPPTGLKYIYHGKLND